MFPWEAMGSPWTMGLFTHGLWAGLAGVTYKKNASQLNSAWNTEASLVHWSSPGLKWLVNITNSRVCVFVCVCAHCGRRTVVSPAQHLSSCQGDLHPLPELWSETSLSMEQCGTELRLAGKRPPALYHRRNTRAGCQILLSQEQGLRGSQETLGGGGWTNRLCSCLLATLVMLCY